MRENILIVERELSRLQEDDIINEKDYESGDKLDIIEMTDDLVRYFCTYDGNMAEKLLIKTMEEVGEEIKQRKGDVMLKFSEIIQNHARQKGLQEGLQEGRQEGLQKGLQEGLQKGRQEGRQEGQRDLILNMIKNKIDLQTIMKCSGLSQEEILKITKT